MSNADELRRNADECMEWAKTAKSDFERDTFLQMAQTWLAAAVYAEGQSRGRGSDPGQARVHGAFQPPPPSEDRPQ